MAFAGHTVKPQGSCFCKPASVSCVEVRGVCGWYRGSRLHEAAAAGCAVLTRSCAAVELEAADLNQAALKAAEGWGPQGSPLAAAASEEGLRCENPTPRRAAG